MKIGIGVRPDGRSGGSIASFLGATKGAYWDFSDSGKVWDDTGGTVPISIGNTVGLLQASAIGTVGTLNWSHATIGPVWQTTYGDHTGTAGLSASANILSIIRNTTVAVASISFRCDDLVAARGLFSLVNAGVTNQRLGAWIGTDGSVNLAVGAAADNATSFYASAALAVTAGTNYTLIMTADWGTGGVGAVRGYLNNGSDIINGTIATPGTMADTAASSGLLGIGPSSTQLDGRIYRAMIANKLPTAAERGMIHRTLAASYS
jgi:hypothetical protein